MNVLYFTNSEITDLDQIVNILKGNGDQVLVCVKKIDLKLIIENKIEFIVSDRSRSLISEDVINHLPNKIINLHPSFLPWGRGYFPNYWSTIKREKKGVTIHYIDKGIDTGDIIIQVEVTMNGDQTLRSSYNLLRFFMVELFRASWSKIRDGSLGSYKQDLNLGSFHFKKDFNGEFDRLRLGWDTPVSELFDGKRM
jgi:methionyl-tRNA formyltransferase